MKGYYYIARYREEVPGVSGAAGRIIMPAGIQAITIDRRHVRPREQRSIFEDGLEGEIGTEPALLLDPQLYLGALACEVSSLTCANLVGYPWFSRQVPEPYDSNKVSQFEYRKKIQENITAYWKGTPQTLEDVRTAVKAAIEFQESVGCTALILPSPLTVDLGTTYATELQWIDAGLTAAAKLAPRLPVYATIAFSDTCTFSQPPSTSRLLELVLDHVTAREIDGVYVVLEQRVETGYYITSPNTLQTILTLVSQLKLSGVGQVLVSYIGTAGHLALAAGADGWASGGYRGERRLKLDDLRDDAGGPAKPAMYCHALCGEVHVEDLDRIRDANALELIEESTPWSEGLFRALRSGRSAKDVPEWTVDTARAHFNTVAIRETDRLLRMNPEHRVSHVKRWLAEGTRRARELSKVPAGPKSKPDRGARRPGLHERTSVAHQATWRGALESWAKPPTDETSRSHSGD